MNAVIFYHVENQRPMEPSNLLFGSGSINGLFDGKSDIDVHGDLHLTGLHGHV